LRTLTLPIYLVPATLNLALRTCPGFGKEMALLEMVFYK
jgi:hypothetical protein